MASEIKIVQSPNDDREYKYLKLKNQLEVILVSDKQTEKSAASLAVKVGHLKDPFDRAGLAHFCEHMLFLGSKKYPKFDEYKSFISKHSGLCNASTNPYKTQYYFEIGNGHFNQALDIFSQCLISPLFNEECVDKEINAVNSEHQKNVQNDGRRYYRTWRLSSKPNNDFLKFGTGNLDTLKFPDIRDRLIEFYNQFYSSNQMKLVIYSNQTIQELEELVQIFEAITDKNLNDVTFDEHPYLNNEQYEWNSYWTLKTVKKKSELEFKFLIDYQFINYENKPASYLSHLIGGEVENSMLSMLLEQNLALSLSSSYGDHMDLFATFSIDIVLTEKGKKNQDQVRNIVFYYLNVLKEKGIQEWIFNENQLIDNLLFKYQTKSKARDWANTLATRLTHNYNREDIILAPYLHRQFKEDIIKKTLEHFTFENMRIYYLSQDDVTPEDVPITEKFYGGQYGFKKMPENIKEEFENPKLNFETKKVLDIPKPNRFLPKDMKYKGENQDKEESEEVIQSNIQRTPEKIFESENCEIYHKQDLTFKTPKLKCAVNIYNDAEVIGDQGKIGTYHYIFIQNFKESIKELLYEAELANINISIGSSSGSSVGVYLSISGFDESLPAVLKEVFKKLGSYKLESQEKFSNYRKKLEDSRKNAFKQTPNIQIGDHSNFVLQDKARSQEQYLESTSNTTYQDYLNFQEQFLTSIKFEWLVVGNMLKEEAIEAIKTSQDELINALEQNKNKRISTATQFQSFRLVKLQEGKSYFYEKQMEQLTDGNSCISSIFQYREVNLRNSLIVEILVNILKQPAFSQLRTTEQLGYIVQTTHFISDQIQGIKILIQSSVQPPQHLALRIENFIETIKEKIENLEQSQFEEYRNSILVRHKDKETSIYQEFSRFFVEVDLHRYNFSRKWDKIKEIESITLQEVQDTFKQIFAKQNKKHLEIHLISNEHLEKNTELKEERLKNNQNLEQITNVNTFKKQQVLYPQYTSKL